MEQRTDNPRRREIHDPINQSVSYATVYGFLPELRGDLKQHDCNIVKAQRWMRDHLLE